MVLSYTDSGQGSVVVLIHGFCETKEIWSAFAHQLSQQYRVVCVDLPGFGESTLSHDAPNISWFASQVKETLDHIGIPKSVMIGHSLGGYVALSFARQYSNHLTGLGLFHSTAYADTPTKKETRDRAIQFIETHGVEHFVGGMFPNLFSEASKKAIPEKIQQLIQKAAQTVKDSSIQVTKAMRDRSDATQVLQEVDIPVLFIVGKEDKAVPLHDSIAQCQLPKDSMLHLLDGVGHMGMLEVPQQSYYGLLQFLNYCDRISSI